MNTFDDYLEQYNNYHDPERISAFFDWLDGNFKDTETGEINTAIVQLYLLSKISLTLSALNENFVALNS